MAKIEIKGLPDELERVATFLKHNNITFIIAPDFGNHSLEDEKAFDQLIEKYNSND